jgi:hypothetical protein
MVAAPATIAWTNVSTLRPGRAPPIRPAIRTIGVDQFFDFQTRDKCRRDHEPGVGDQVRLAEAHLDPVQTVR